MRTVTVAFLFSVLGASLFADDRSALDKARDRAMWVEAAHYKIVSEQNWGLLARMEYIQKTAGHWQSADHHRKVLNAMRASDEKLRALAKSRKTYKAIPEKWLETFKTANDAIGSVGGPKGKAITVVGKGLLGPGVLFYEDHVSPDKQLEAQKKRFSQYRSAYGFSHRILKRKLERYYDAVNSGKSNRVTALDESAMQQDLGFAVSFSAEKILGENTEFAKHEWVRKTYEKIQSLDADSLKQLLPELQTLAEQNFDEMMKKADNAINLLDRLANEKLDKRAAEEALAERQRQYQIAQLELQASRSALNVLQQLIGFADPKLGQQIGAIGNTAIDIVSAIEEYGQMIELGSYATSMSAIITTGNFLSATFNLISVLQGNPSETEIILKRLEAIENRLIEFEKRMHERFDRIDLALENIYKAIFGTFDVLSKQLEQVALGVKINQQELRGAHIALVSQRAALRSLEHKIDAYFEKLFEKFLTDNLVECVWPERYLGKSLTPGQYQKCLIKFAQCAVHSDTEVEQSFQKLTLVSDDFYTQSATQMQKPVEKNVNFLRWAATNRFNVEGVSKLKLANPIQWAACSEAYLEFANRWTEFFPKESLPQELKGLTQKILNRGTELKRVRDELLKTNLLDKVIEEYGRLASKFVLVLQERVVARRQKEFHGYDPQQSIDQDTNHTPKIDKIGACTNQWMAKRSMDPVKRREAWIADSRPKSGRPTVTYPDIAIKSVEKEDMVDWQVSTPSGFVEFIPKRFLIAESLGLGQIQICIRHLDFVDRQLGFDEPSPRRPKRYMARKGRLAVAIAGFWYSKNSRRQTIFTRQIKTKDLIQYRWVKYDTNTKANEIDSLNVKIGETDYPLTPEGLGKLLTQEWEKQGGLKERFAKESSPKVFVGGTLGDREHKYLPNKIPRQHAIGGVWKWVDDFLVKQRDYSDTYIDETRRGSEHVAEKVRLQFFGESLREYAQLKTDLLENAKLSMAAENMAVAKKMVIAYLEWLRPNWLIGDDALRSTLFGRDSLMDELQILEPVHTLREETSFVSDVIALHETGHRFGDLFKPLLVGDEKLLGLFLNEPGRYDSIYQERLAFYEKAAGLNAEYYKPAFEKLKAFKGRGKQMRRLLSFKTLALPSTKTLLEDRTVKAVKALKDSLTRLAEEGIKVQSHSILDATLGHLEFMHQNSAESTPER